MNCVGEVCNFHEIQQIMQHYGVRQASLLLTWKQKKRQLTSPFFILTTHLQTIPNTKDFWYHLFHKVSSFWIMFYEKFRVLNDRWEIFLLDNSLDFSEFLIFFLLWTKCLTSLRSDSSPSPVIPQDDRSWQLAVLLLLRNLLISSREAAPGRSCLLAIRMIGGPDLSVSFMRFCSSSLASSSLSELSRTNNMRSVSLM